MVIPFIVTCLQGYSQVVADSLRTGNDSTAHGSIASPITPPAPKPEFRKDVAYIVKTNLDITYVGFITEETEFYIRLEDRRTREIYEIRRGEIKSIKIFYDKKVYVDMNGENSHARNYMFASSAFLFDAETITSTYHWFALENIDYAITENFAVTAGSLFFYPVSIGAKCALKIDENNYLGGNVFGVANISANSGNTIFMGYGGIAKFTRGTSNQNFTIAGGMLGISSDALFSTPQKVPYYNFYFSNVSYCSRLNEHVALSLEGWYLPQAQLGFAGAGIKLVKNEDYCWTFGCYSVLNLLNNNVTLNFKALPIPYIGMSQKF